jgi:hypothetical protein
MVFLQSLISICYLLKGRNGFGVSFPPYSHGFFRFSKVQTFGHTFCDAGRLKTFIDAVHTIVTFDNRPGLGIPLGRAPWTSRNAGFTADTIGWINKDDPVLWSFLHSAGGAGCYTPRFFTVEAGHIYMRHARQILY